MAVTGRRQSVETTPELVCSAEGDDGISVVIRNKSADVCDIGGINVTVGAGFGLAQDEAVTIDMAPGETIYGVSAGTSVLHILEARKG